MADWRRIQVKADVVVQVKTNVAAIPDKAGDQKQLGDWMEQQILEYQRSQGTALRQDVRLAIETGFRNFSQNSSALK
jgi:hypothetical protein